MDADTFYTFAQAACPDATRDDAQDGAEAIDAAMAAATPEQEALYRTIWRVAQFSAVADIYWHIRSMEGQG